MEIKFIITKDGKHFKSDWKHHYTIARDNGYSERDIVECGIFLDKFLYIVECQSKEHIGKHRQNYVGNALNEYQDLRLISWLRARDLESQYYYRIKGQKDGD